MNLELFPESFGYQLKSSFRKILYKLGGFTLLLFYWDPTVCTDLNKSVFLLPEQKCMSASWIPYPYPL